MQQDARSAPCTSAPYPLACYIVWYVPGIYSGLIEKTRELASIRIHTGTSRHLLVAKNRISAVLSVNREPQITDIDDMARIYNRAPYHRQLQSVLYPVRTTVVVRTAAILKGCPLLRRRRGAGCWQPKRRRPPPAAATSSRLYVTCRVVHLRCF